MKNASNGSYEGSIATLHNVNSKNYHEQIFEINGLNVETVYIVEASFDDTINPITTLELSMAHNMLLVETIEEDTFAPIVVIDNVVGSLVSKSIRCSIQVTDLRSSIDEFFIGIVSQDYLFDPRYSVAIQIEKIYRAYSIRTTNIFQWSGGQTPQLSDVKQISEI